jgi:hypothetical protein
MSLDNELENKMSSVIDKMDSITNYLDKGDNTNLEYLKKKVKNLENMLPTDKLKNGTAKSRDLENIIEGVVEGLEEIDEYLPHGINSATELIDENKEKLTGKLGQSLKLLIPLSTVLTYWNYLNRVYHKKIEAIVEKHHNPEPDNDDAHTQASKNIHSERSTLKAPKYKDLLPLLVFTLTAHYTKKGPYATILGSLIAQFTLR